MERVAPRYLPEDFDRPAVMLVEMGETLGRRIGLKTDWYCLCLEADAILSGRSTPFSMVPSRWR